MGRQFLFFRPLFPKPLEAWKPDGLGISPPLLGIAIFVLLKVSSGKWFIFFVTFYGPFHRVFDHLFVLLFILFQRHKLETGQWIRSIQKCIYSHIFHLELCFLQLGEFSGDSHCCFQAEADLPLGYNSMELWRRMKEDKLEPLTENVTNWYENYKNVLFNIFTYICFEL